MCPVKTQVKAFLGGVFDMDIEPALRIGVVKGGKAVIAGIVDMQGCEVGGGVAVDINHAVRSDFAGAFRKKEISGQHGQAKQGGKKSHVGRIRF